MVCAGNSCSSEQAMDQSFLQTNVFAQLSKFNNSIWKKLENRVRKLVDDYELVQVFTGPAFKPIKEKDGTEWIKYRLTRENGTAIPTHFFKVIYAHNRGKTQGMAYLVPHENIGTETEPEVYLVTIENVQRITGIQFDMWRNL